MRRADEASARALSGVVASYVAANPRKGDLTARLPDLHEYVRRAGISDLSREELERAVLDHWNRLEGIVERARREAELFRPGQPTRPPRYRHGSPYCPSCRFYKEYRKECPNCGYLELTQ